MLNPESERILVTGGTGFIGRYVVNLLLEDGFRPLVTTFKKTSDKAGLSERNVELVGVDLTDSEEIHDLIKNYKPQIVFHFAGVTANLDSTGQIHNEVNFNGTVNLIRALERYGVKRVILLGSAAEYGDQPTPFREDSEPRPVSLYAISKAKANKFALDMFASTGFPVTIIRVFTAYGYGQPPQMFLPQVITHGLLNKIFNMSDGFQKRDFVSVEDVAAALKASITAENALGKIINIAGGKGVALRELAQKVWEICAAEEDLLKIGLREKHGDDRVDSVADISLAKEILNWSPGPGILSESDNYARLRGMIEKTRRDVSFTASR